MGSSWGAAPDPTGARCAAATPDCRVLDTAPPPARTTPAGTDRAAEDPAAEREQVYTVTHQLLTPDQRLTGGGESNYHVVLA